MGGGGGGKVVRGVIVNGGRLGGSRAGEASGVSFFSFSTIIVGGNMRALTIYALGNWGGAVSVVVFTTALGAFLGGYTSAGGMGKFEALEALGDVKKSLLI